MMPLNFDREQAAALLKERAKKPLSAYDIASKAHYRWDRNQYAEAALLFCLACECAAVEAQASPDSKPSAAHNHYARAAINFNMAGEHVKAQPMLEEVTRFDWQALNLPNDSNMCEWAFEQLMLNAKAQANASQFAALFAAAQQRCQQLGWAFPKIHPKQETLLQAAMELGFPAIAQSISERMRQRSPLSREAHALLKAVALWLAENAANPSATD